MNLSHLRSGDFDLWSLDESEFESELELSESDPDEESESESDPDDDALARASISSYFFLSSSYGASLMNSRRSSVSAPSPILVKKLMEKRAFCTESRGNSPSRWGFKPFSEAALSEILSTRFCRPRFEAISCIKILMKIRDDAVVVSSVSLMQLRQLHDI